MEGSLSAKLFLSPPSTCLSKNICLPKKFEEKQRIRPGKENTFPKYEITKLPTMHTKEAAESG